MKVAVLDGYTLNPGDLSWKNLESIAEVTVYDKTSPDEVYDRVKDCEAVLSNKVVFSKELIARLPRLRYIGVLATGYNVIDLDAARAAGIVVTNIPAYATDSVAQLVFAFIFQFYWHIKEHSDEVHAGTWARSAHFCYTSFPLFELTGKTLGIIGFGRIGQKVAALALAMGMRVLYVNRSLKTVPYLAGALQVDLDALLTQSDIISLNVPLTNGTEKILNADALSKVKSHALIINTGRGQLVDDAAVAAALKNGTLGGYASDVLSTEPPPADHPLFGCPHCLLTPHIAWQSFEARSRLLNTAVDNLKSFLAGKAQNTVL
ncbi:MAG: D-2-hydroxyacid dehydrogenase [Treponema sp.]